MIPLMDFIKALDLEYLELGDNAEIALETSDDNRPGLQLCGFFDYFATDRLQVIGKAEMEYLLSLEPKVRKARLDAYMSYPVPVVVICRNMECPPELLEAAQAHRIPLLRSRLVTTRFSLQASSYIAGCLVKRGHRLVADDVVDIRKVNDQRLVGEAPEVLRHFMEIRGVGVINVKSMYGVGAVINSKSIDIVCHMELWDENKEYDRLGFNEEFTAILGVKVPLLVLPVRPGRNLAIVIEVAASNFRLKAMGYHGAKELNERLMQRAAQQQAQAETPPARPN